MSALATEAETESAVRAVVRTAGRVKADYDLARKEMTDAMKSVTGPTAGVTANLVQAHAQFDLWRSVLRFSLPLDDKMCQQTCIFTEIDRIDGDRLLYTVAAERSLCTRVLLDPSLLDHENRDGGILAVYTNASRKARGAFIQQTRHIKLPAF